MVVKLGRQDAAHEPETRDKVQGKKQVENIFTRTHCTDFCLCHLSPLTFPESNETQLRCSFTLNASKLPATKVAVKN